jgi:hypothetical protein
LAIHDTINATEKRPLCAPLSGAQYYKETDIMTASPHDHGREPLSREAVLTITVLVVSTFTVILNEMLMGVAMPRVMADLDITASTAQWLTTAYMLTMAVVIPATGFLTERYQMRTVFTLAMRSGRQLPLSPQGSTPCWSPGSSRRSAQPL